MGELSKINGKLEIKNGTANSTDVIQELRDENDNIIAEFQADNVVKVADFYKLLTTGPGSSSIALETYKTSRRKWVLTSYGADGGSADIASVYIRGKNINSDGQANFNNIVSLKFWGNALAQHSGILPELNIYGVVRQSYELYGGDVNINGGYHSIDNGETESSHIELRGGVNIGNKSRFVNIYNTVKTQGRRKEITTITSATYTTDKTDNILEIDASSNSVQVELLEPSDDNKGQEFVIDIYNTDNLINLLAFSKDHFDVDTITDEGNNIFRYALKGTFDISGVQVGDLIKTSNATNAGNNGIWEVQAVGTDYIDITNANGIAEASDSTCELQLNIMNVSDFVVNETRTYIAYSHRNSYKRIN